MKILAFGASNSKNSINKKLATYATTFFENAAVNIIDLNDFEMPVFSVDVEAVNGHPEEAKKFVALIGASDLVIISFAEHNGSYSTAFKNIFDWASRVNGKLFQEKPLILLATSPGIRGGLSVLETAKTRLPFHAATVIGTFSLPEFYKNFSIEDGITNGEMKEAFLKFIEDAKSELLNK